jgi:zinc transporter 1/2/3
MAEDNILPRGLPSWADIPTAILQAELAKRQNDETERPACGGGIQGSYNTSIHVAALVLILLLSVACKHD